MSATLAPNSAEAARLTPSSTVTDGTVNGSTQSPPGLSASQDCASLDGHVMRSGTVDLARIGRLMAMGIQLGYVETNNRGVKSLVLETETHGAIRVLDFTATQSGLAHPYRVQRLRYDPEDFFVNSRSSDSSRLRQRRASYVQGGLSEPQIGINELLNAASNYLLIKAEDAARKSRIQTLRGHDDDELRLPQRPPNAA